MIAHDLAGLILRRVVDDRPQLLLGRILHVECAGFIDLRHGHLHDRIAQQKPVLDGLLYLDPAPVILDDDGIDHVALGLGLRLVILAEGFELHDSIGRKHRHQHSEDRVYHVGHVHADRTGSVGHLVSSRPAEIVIDRRLAVGLDLVALPVGLR